MAGSTIPVWDEGPKGVEGPGPTLQKPITPALAELGHVAQGLEVGGQVFQAKLNEANQYAAADLDTQAAREIAGALKAHSLLEGKEALNTSRFHEAIRSIKDRYLESAQDGDQRNRLARMMAPRLASAEVQLENHAGQQAKVYHKNLAETGLVEATQRLQENPWQAGAIEAEYQALAPTIALRAEEQGLPEEGRAQMLRGALGALMEAQIRGFLVLEDGGSAQEAFERRREFLYQIDHKRAEALRQDIKAKWGKEKAIALAREALGKKRPGNDYLVDLREGMAFLSDEAGKRKLDAEELLHAEQYFKANAEFAQHAYNQRLQEVADAGRSQWETGNARLGIPPYTDPELSVDASVKRWLQDPNNPGGPAAWEQLKGWHQTYVNRDRINANLPSDAQRRRAGEIDLMLIQEPDLAARLPYATFAEQFVNGRDPRTGEPLLTPSQADDVKRAFLEAAKRTQFQKPPRIVADKDILLDELQVQGWIPTSRGKTGEKVRDPESWNKPTTYFAAWEYFAGDLAKWRERNPDSSDDDVRKYVRERMSAEKERQFKERSYNLWPSTIYGFELERRRNDKGGQAYNRNDWIPVGKDVVPPNAPEAARIATGVPLAPPRFEAPAGGWKRASSIGDVPPEIVKYLRASRPKATDKEIIDAHNLNVAKGRYGKGE